MYSYIDQYQTTVVVAAAAAVVVAAAAVVVVAIHSNCASGDFDTRQDRHN